MSTIETSRFLILLGASAAVAVLSMLDLLQGGWSTLRGRLLVVPALVMMVVGGGALLSEAAVALSSESVYERSQFWFRIYGPHAWVFWCTTGGTGLPLLYWFAACYRRPWLRLAIALLAIVPTLIVEAQFARYDLL